MVKVFSTQPRHFQSAPLKIIKIKDCDSAGVHKNPSKSDAAGGFAAHQG